MAKLIIIADRGRIRSVKFREAGEDPIEQDHLVEDQNGSSERPILSRGEIVTDQSGRFSRNAPAGEGGGMSYGEQHNLESELERKTLRSLAKMIADIVSEEDYPRWNLAAPRSILRRLEGALPRECRDVLDESIGADLTKEPLAKLEKRFGIGR